MLFESVGHSGTWKGATGEVMVLLVRNQENFS